jgi:hypothetical protein
MRYKQYEITVGHDAEVFLWDRMFQQYVSAASLIGGTKERPKPCKGGALQEDNIMAELNIYPAHTAHQFIKHTHLVMGELRTIIEPLNYDIRIEAAIQFNPKVIYGRECLQFGCDPDFSAYAMSQNEINFEYMLDNYWRTAAGHIHIGIRADNGTYPIQTFEDSAQLARICDRYLGVFALLNDPDEVRSNFYGIPGNFRPKPYGTEYRTMSNFWLKTPEHMKQVFLLATKAAKHFLDLHERGENLVEESQVYEILASRNKVVAAQL